MPPYASALPFPVAADVATSGLNLPSSPRLTQRDVEYVASRVRAHVEHLEAGDVFGGVCIVPETATPAAPVDVAA